MRSFTFAPFPITIILIGTLLYAHGKQTNHDVANVVLADFTQTEPAPFLLQTALAGPTKSLASNVNILHVFILYDHISNHAATNHKDNSWQHLETRLQIASKLDPYFWDTYRLTTGLLAYREGRGNKAIALLERGSQYRTWDWETPFLAGFLAYDVLGDTQLAAALMQTSATRPNAPDIAMALAARFLSQSASPEEGIKFLIRMKSLLPENMRAMIEWRIKQLKKDTKSYQKSRHEKHS